MYNKIEENYYGDESDYKDEIIQPLFYPNYPEETGHLDKKWFKVYLSPDLNAMDDDGEDYSPQFWGQSAYGIVINQYIGLTDSINPDAISLAQFKAITEDRRHQATDWGVKLNTTRSYSTYAPAVIGYDPIRQGYWASLTNTIGGTSSMTDGRRDHSFDYFNETISLNIDTPSGIIQQFHFDAEGYEIDEPTWETGYDAYTRPPCFLDYLHPNLKASDLHVYLVISHAFNYPADFDNQYQMCWVIYSERSDYYKIIPALPSFSGLDLPYGEPTNEPEGDEPDVPIPIPSLPTLDITSAGVKLFRAGDFTDLINYMWGNDSIFNGINKLIGDQTPYECIVGMNLFPYGESLYNGSTEDIYIGNINTNCQAPRTKQFAEIDFGTATITRQFNNALDFSPYTVIELFLPFIGKVKLPTDFVMGKTIGVTYHMDCLTGACFAFITTDTEGVIQCEGGSCLIQLPLTAQTASGARQAISSAMSAGATLAVAGGMSSTISANTSATNRLIAGSNVVGGINSGVNQALNALAAKDSYTTFGGMSLANGYLGLSNPILYIHRPINATPAGYNTIMGYAASTIQTLSSLSGYTQVKEINLGISGASREDLEEIEVLLKEGVIL